MLSIKFFKNISVGFELKRVCNKVRAIDYKFLASVKN